MTCISHFLEACCGVKSITVFIYVVIKRLKKSENWAECCVVAKSRIIHLLELLVPHGDNVTIVLSYLSSVEFLRRHPTAFDSVEKISQEALFGLIF